MSTIRVVNLQHTDATEPNIVLLEDGTSVFASGITISGGTNLTVSGTAEFASGTVSAPGVTFIDDNNTGLYSPAADTVAITTAATERVRVDSSGNVGIGTTPAVNLHVKNASSTGRIRIEGGGSSSAQLQFIAGGQTNPYVITQDTSRNLIFFDNATERLRIDSSGNVIVGTSTTVNPTLRILGTSAHNSFVQFADGDSNNVCQLQYNHPANALITAVNGSEAMRIDSSGRVLLGTTTVGAAAGDNLTIADSTNAGITIRSSATGAGSILFEDTASDRGEIQYSHNGDYMRFKTAANERMRIDSSGHVSIGTTTANRTFQVGKNGAETFELEPGESANNNLSLHFNRNTNAYITNEIRAWDHKFFHQATEIARMDSAGKLLVGTSSSFQMGRIGAIQVAGGTGAGANNAFISATRFGTISGGGELTLGASYGSNGNHSLVPNGHQLGLIGFVGSDGTTGRYTSIIRSEVDGTPGVGVMPGRLGFMTTPSNSGANPIERMRINNNGYLRIMCQNFGADPSSSNQGIQLSNPINAASRFSSGSTTSNVNQIAFINGNGVVGTIATNGSATAYNTSSDYRLKENVVDIADGITRVKQLSPKRFNFIADADTIVDGFIAHEAQAVVPEAVTGEKDSEEMQGIDQSKLVPLLTAALKEAIGRIETLETEVAALKNN